MAPKLSLQQTTTNDQIEEMAITSESQVLHGQYKTKIW